MRAGEDGMNVVRAELCDRLRTLQLCSARHSSRNFHESVVGIRRLAAAYGLTPVVRLAEALERAAQDRSAGACPTGLYLDRLQDAIGCERLDEAASEAMIASISVRLA
ncbi:MAG TPA: hypothetical protein VF662_16505 [Allosphingosinicella sp.]